MDERSILGLIGTLVVVSVAVAGLSAFLRSFVVDTAAGAEVAPTLGVLVVTAVFVAALTVWGAKSDRWRQNPYW